MALAIFDLDNTLLAGDSDHAWGEFLCRKKRVDVDSYRQQNEAFYQDYCRGELDVFAYQRFALAPLVGKEPSVLRAWHNEFMEESIQPIWLKKAEELITKHKDQGDFLLIITATNRFITQPIADRLGVDDLLATEPEVIGEQYTGEITGIPCYQEGKVKRLDQWLENNPHSMQDSFFYSDSHNDLPLLEKVTNPVAVDPDDTLKAHAEKKGWSIISLR